MAKTSSRSPYDIAPGATFAQAARSALQEQLDTLMKNLPGTRAGDDIEALHDMRVASRRLRAALSVFAAAFSAKTFQPLEKEVARVTDALGAVRDADVQIEYLTQVAETVSESERVGIAAFSAHLSAQRDHERVILVKELNRLEKSKFAKDFEAMLNG